MTDFQKRARRLAELLLACCGQLAGYRRDDRSAYTSGLAAKLRPLAEDFRDAVVRNRSRERAESLFADIKLIMEEVNAAATKGEMDLFPPGTLDEYWRLAATFQETQFAGEKL